MLTHKALGSWQPRFPSAHPTSTNQTQHLTPYNIATSQKMSGPHVDDAINSPNTTYCSNNRNSFNDNFVWNLNFGVTDERSEILAWLSPIEPRIRHQDIRTRRADNVGEWLMQTDEFQGWCNGAQQEGSGPTTLLCCGDPAVGKTYFT